MKHEFEINTLINEIMPKESWMSDEDHNEFVEFTFSKLGMSRQKLSDDIDVGLKNGYSVDFQMALIKQCLT